MAEGFLQYFFRWISGGAVVGTPPDAYTVEYATSFLPGLDHAEGLPVGCIFSTSFLPGSEHTEGVPL